MADPTPDPARTYPHSHSHSLHHLQNADPDPTITTIPAVPAVPTVPTPCKPVQPARLAQSGRPARPDSSAATPPAAPPRYCRIESTSSIDETEFPRMTWGRGYQRGPPEGMLGMIIRDVKLDLDL
jgi:hypothetical protein